LCNLAFIRREAGQFDDAGQLYRRVIQLADETGDAAIKAKRLAQYGLGMSLLGLGDTDRAEPFVFVVAEAEDFAVGVCQPDSRRRIALLDAVNGFARKPLPVSDEFGAEEPLQRGNEFGAIGFDCDALCF